VLIADLAVSTAGKFPTPVSHAEYLTNELNEDRSTIEFQLKKALCLGVGVGHVQMSEDHVLGNVIHSAFCFILFYFSFDLSVAEAAC